MTAAPTEVVPGRAGMAGALAVGSGDGDHRYGGGSGRGASGPSPRRGARRRGVTALLALAIVAAGISALSYVGSRGASAGRATVRPAAAARGDAAGFLRRYLAPDGRVVRRDQHGDTVSEGQAYAMLLAVAIGQPQPFARAWRWDRAHLQEPTGLFAYRWQHGHVATAQPAADADLETAWALVLGAARFGNPAYRMAGLQVSSAVLADETTEVAGRPELVAGPWAVGGPTAVDPSYLAPEAMATLGRASGDPRWAELSGDATDLLDRLPSADAGRLPPNWVDLATDGAPRAVGSPSGRGQPAYGLDAQRVPVWLAASCSSADRRLAAGDWPVLAATARRGAAISYTLSGRRTARSVNPLGLVATAAAATAAGHHRVASTLLAQADRQVARFHTYYGDAWAALGRVLLTTRWLAPCGGRGP